MKKVLLDTDIGNDTDDLSAITYLLSQPECDLKAVMTVTGDVRQRAGLADCVCRCLHKNIPIFAGSSTTLDGRMRQEGPSECHQPLLDALGTLPVYPGLPEGLRYFRDTIVENPHEITLIAIGPETNVALLFATYPETVGLLKEMVVMGGSFFENPACTWDITAEWNIRCDPMAAKIALEAPVAKRTVVGVDLTWNFQRTRAQVCAMLAPNPKLKPVYDVFAGSPDETFWFHDPLTCASAFLPSFGEGVVGNIHVELSADKLAQTTVVPNPDGHTTVYRTFAAGDAAYYAYHADMICGKHA